MKESNRMDASKLSQIAKAQEKILELQMALRSLTIKSKSTDSKDQKEEDKANGQASSQWGMLSLVGTYILFYCCIDFSV